MENLVEKEREAFLVNEVNLDPQELQVQQEALVHKYVCCDLYILCNLYCFWNLICPVSFVRETIEYIDSIEIHILIGLLFSLV